MFVLRVSNQGRAGSPLAVGSCALRGQTASPHMQRVGAVSLFGLRVSSQDRLGSPLGVGGRALCGQTAIILACRESGRFALSGYELVTRADWTVR